MTKETATQASMTMMKRNAAFSTICSHLQAASNDDEDGQPSASNLDAAAPNNPYEHPGCRNELYLDPPRRQC
jgi:hypothetical protein